MAQASDDTTVDSFVREHREAVGDAKNKAGFESADAEFQRIREAEGRHSGPLADLPKDAQKAMRRAGLL